MMIDERLIEDARVAFTEAWEAEDRRVENEDRDARGTHSRSRAGIIAALAVFREHWSHTQTVNGAGCSNPDCPLERAHSGPCAPRDWTQGEPSDAQVRGLIGRAQSIVDAMMSSTGRRTRGDEWCYVRYGQVESLDVVLAALRAASEAGGEGR